VRSHLTFAAIAAVMSCLISSQAFAQSGDSQSGRVAVIDISQVYKNHPQFKSAMQTLKSDFEDTQTKFRQRRDQIQTAVEDLRETYTIGTEDYRNREREITQMQADLQADMALAKKDFQEREARIFYNTYNHIAEEVKYVADRYGFNLVLRYNSGAITPENPNSVMEGVNRLVVYQRNLNITSLILERLPPAERGATHPGGPVPYHRSPR
jgi:Skp family chaperone for outer membrane proteins